MRHLRASPHELGCRPSELTGGQPARMSEARRLQRRLSRSKRRCAIGEGGWGGRGVGRGGTRPARRLAIAGAVSQPFGERLWDTASVHITPTGPDRVGTGVPRKPRDEKAPKRGIGNDIATAGSKLLLDSHGTHTSACLDRIGAQVSAAAVTGVSLRDRSIAMGEPELRANRNCP